MSKESAVAMLQGTAPVPSAAPVITSTPGGEPGLQAVTPETAPKVNLESTRLAHLAKKESELQRQRDAFKKEQETYKQELEKYKPTQQKLQEFEALKAKDPVAALKLAGFSEADLMNFIAETQDTSTPEERAAKAAAGEIKKFRDEEAAKEKKIQDERNTHALSEHRKRISSTLAADPDKYELCNHNGPLAIELIEETVTAVLMDSQELISPQEAAEMVEQYYEDTYKSMSNLKKLKPAEAVVAAKEAAAPLKPEVSPRPAPKTLSSKVNATAASTIIPRKESAEDKKQRLIKKYITG